MISPAESFRDDRGFLEGFYRRDYAAVVAGLVKRFGGAAIDLIEDCVQDALIATLERERRGYRFPRSPRAWIFVLARRRIINALKRESCLASKLELNPKALETRSEPEDARDDVLRLMMFCCRPQFKPADQVALILNLVFGFRGREIADSFVLREATVAQRLTRLKRRLRSEVFPPSGDRSSSADPVRYAALLRALYLVFSEGHHASRAGGEGPLRKELCGSASNALEDLLEIREFDSPAARGLFALFLLHTARFPARENQNGDLLLLEEQDRGLWDRELIAKGLALLAQATAAGGADEYRLLATIAGLHAVAESWEATDWPRIVDAYDLLYHLRPDPLVGLNYGVAVAMQTDSRNGIRFIEALPGLQRLNRYWLYHSTLGELHRRAGDKRAARAAFERASGLVRRETYVRFLNRKLEAIRS